MCGDAFTTCVPRRLSAGEANTIRHVCEGTEERIGGHEASQPWSSRGQTLLCGSHGQCSTSISGELICSVAQYVTTEICVTDRECYEVHYPINNFLTFKHNYGCL